MKAKLIWLMVLSIITSIGLIMLIAAAANTGVYTGGYGYYYSVDRGIWDIGYGIAGGALMIISWIAQFILGIVVLSTLSHVKEGKGITIAAGIIGIFGGIFFVGAIISGIAAAQVKESKNAFVSSSTNTPQPVQETELEQMKRELEELKKANAQRVETQDSSDAKK